MVFNGKANSGWLSREYTSIPTASLENIFMQKMDAYEWQDIMVLDVTNSLIQTNMPPKKDGKERVIIIITGVLVDMILELDRDIYSNHVVFENEKKLIYFFALRAIYVMLVASLHFYKKFHEDLEDIGF